MKILILGQGGREDAFYQVLKQNLSRDSSNRVFIMPGNAGALPEDRILGSVDDWPAIIDVIHRQNIDLVLVGPERPLVNGLADNLAKHCFVFGPSQKAAMLEGSKAFAKAFMNKYHIPSADYRLFSEQQEALNYVAVCDYPIVIKASGLAAGKGVTICQNQAEADQSVRQAMTEKIFGDSGLELVIESFLTGHEASLFVVSDGQDFQILGSAQDYKRAYDNDQGPNTGGMGAFSPAKLLDSATLATVMETIVHPTFAGLAQEKISYVGVLYFGLLFDAQQKPWLIEYNCRMGDPEAQVVLPLLKTPLIDILAATRERRLVDCCIEHKSASAVTVVLAKDGYPGDYEKNAVIPPIDVGIGCQVFRAGSDVFQGRELSTGGRVLNVTASADTLSQARARVYQTLVDWEGQGLLSGFFYRRDIAQHYC